MKRKDFGRMIPVGALLTLCAVFSIGCGGPLTVSDAFVTSVVVNAPVGEVFSYVTDPAHTSEWGAGTTSNRQGSGLGATSEWTYEVEGIKVSAQVITVDYVPNQRTVARYMSDTLDMTVISLYLPVDGGTKLTWVLSYTAQVPRALKAVVGVAKRKNREATQEQLNKIKAALEK